MNAEGETRTSEKKKMLDKVVVETSLHLVGGERMTGEVVGRTRAAVEAAREEAGEVRTDDGKSPSRRKGKEAVTTSAADRMNHPRAERMTDGGRTTAAVAGMMTGEATMIVGERTTVGERRREEEQTRGGSVTRSATASMMRSAAAEMMREERSAKPSARPRRRSAGGTRRSFSGSAMKSVGSRTRSGRRLKSSAGKIGRSKTGSEGRIMNGSAKRSRREIKRS
mmetsp:Transcript_138084/g.344790  ORF Transcript_138084/g.344790 Transcript_138084/m.344790 type:complete len:224 (+) Transcript_138084:1640-2311(+)